MFPQQICYLIISEGQELVFSILHGPMEISELSGTWNLFLRFVNGSGEQNFVPALYHRQLIKAVWRLCGETDSS